MRVRHLLDMQQLASLVLATFNACQAKQGLTHAAALSAKKSVPAKRAGGLDGSL